MQEFVRENIIRRFVTITANNGLELFSSKGPVTDQLYGAIQTETSLKVAVVSALNFSIQPGTGLLEDGELIRVASVVNSAASGVGDKYYLVSLVYTEAGAVPITAQTAFVYDKTGGTPYSTKDTEYTDSYTITLTDIGAAGAISPEENELPLAIIKTNPGGTALLTTAWTRLTETAVAGVIDLRASYSLKLNHDLLDDATVLFKDRASTGANAFTQDVDFTGTVNLIGDIAVPNITSTTVKIGVGTLGVGGTGLEVATVQGTPKKPLNLRIYDINPFHSDEQAKISEVVFKWNWVGLKGTSATGTLTINDVNTGEDALVVTVNQLAGYPIYSAKFAPADNTYVINSNTATVGGSTVLSIAGIGAGESPDTSEPASVRCDAGGYKFKIVPNVAGTDVEEQARLYLLDELYVSSQKFSEFLTLERNYNIYAKSVSGYTESSYTVMSGGSYDPDHTEGGQGSEAYTAPFTNALPDLDDTDSELTLLPDSFGFEGNLTAGGWEVGGEADQTAHEYEWAYKQAATGTTIDWTDTTNVVLQRQASKKFTYAAADAARFVVGVRPLQNRQVVGTPIVGSVVSGGGGLQPGDMPFSVRIYLPSWTYTSITDVGAGVYRLNGVVKAGGATGDGAAIAAAMAGEKWDRIWVNDDTSTEYEVDMDTALTGAGAADSFEIEFVSGTPSLGAGGINTGPIGRLIQNITMPHEYKGVQASLAVQKVLGATEGDSSKIRIYQNTTTPAQAQADILEFWQNTTYNSDLDVQILNSYGALGLVIDCWDPATVSAVNDTYVIADLTVYFRSLSTGGKEKGVA